MKTKLAIITVALLAIFMRFYRLPELLHWTMDEEYWSYIPFNIATGYHFPLIGGSIADTGVYTTPWFVYLMSVVAIIGRGNPVAFGIFVSALGVLTAFLVYFLGKKMFGERTAVFGSILYSGSTLMALWDRHYWNASLTPFLSLLALYFVFTRRLVLLALVLTIAVSAHGTGVSIFLFAAIALLVQRTKSKKMIVAAAIFLLSFGPVFLFETRHGFLELRALANYFTVKRKNTQTFPDRFKTVAAELVNTSAKLFIFEDNNDVASQLTLGDSSLNRGRPGWVAYLPLLAIVVATVTRRGLVFKLAWLQIGATILGLLIFRSPVSSYYYTPMAIPLFLLAGSGFGWVWERKIGKFLVAPLILILITANLGKLLFSYHSSSYPAKLQAVQRAITLAGNEPFAFNARCLNHCQLYGFRYLFTYLGHEPAKSYMDPYFSWLYDDRLPKQTPAKEINFFVNGNTIVINAEKI